ncbi:MAG TPA: formate dehydrogenase accessory sulfurtransferase FdhD [Candidatus Methylacidiphilales bacterium]|jgi:FdhD protein|nr:formate dehydrogenase accessory sulfurtransferase FdhD [Candidatus Methylacidiphilales bacterium]
MGDKRSLSRTIRKVTGVDVRMMPDQLALEEPLEIQIAYGQPESRQWKTVAITMRTPGHDRELAAGFLVGEGLLRSLDQIEAVHSRGPRYGEEGFRHSVRVTLRPGVDVDLARLERNFYTTSSCGVCGKTSLEALELNIVHPLPKTEWQVDRATICALPARLRESQAIFDQTGGLHAAGIFTPEGKPVIVREDVGRHNAVDKVIGTEFLAGRLPLSHHVLVVSGRASFELMQKALAAGIAMLVAVGAPSSLALETAEKFGATLVGFTKADSFNIYTGEQRVRVSAPAPTASTSLS